MQCIFVWQNIMHIVCYYEIAVFSVQLILACGTAICTHLLPHF